MFKCFQPCQPCNPMRLIALLIETLDLFKVEYQYSLVLVSISLITKTLNLFSCIGHCDFFKNKISFNLTYII